MKFWRKSQKGGAEASSLEGGEVEVRRVLIIKLTDLRGFVEMLAAAAQIRERYVGARVTLLTTAPFKALAEASPYFDVVEAEAAHAALNESAPSASAAGIVDAIDAARALKIAGRIRAAKFDMIFDFEKSKLTSGFFQLVRIGGAHWSGEVEGCSHPLHMPANGSHHPLDVLATQMRDAGVSVREPVLPDMRWLKNALQDAPRIRPEYFGLRGPYVVLTPSAESADSQSAWPVDKYLELARRIVAQGAVPVVLGGSEVRSIGATIAAKEPKAKNLVVRTDVFQTISLCQRAAHVVGDDVETMHIAAAAGASCVALLSSLADLDETTPRGRGGVVAVTAAVVADLPVEQIDRQLRNSGAYIQTGAA